MVAQHDGEVLRHIIITLFLSVFAVTFVAAPKGTPGCSCSSTRKVNSNVVATGIVAPPKSLVKRDAPPLMSPESAPPKVEQMIFRDDESGITFTFESDGQHVTATNKEGKVLWRRNPAVETGMKGFSKGDQTVWPTICSAGPPTDWMVELMRERGKQGAYIGISFNTKYFGLLEIATGDYTSMGSD